MPNNPQAGIHAGLALVGKHFAERMKNKLDAGNYPSGDSERGTTSIQDATSVGTPQQEGNSAYIDVVIDLRMAPFAGAFEKGSGLHGEGGSKYPIEPVQANALAFLWPEAENIDPERLQKLPDGRVVLDRVAHPGIEARPYIRPTIEEERGEITRILAREFVAQLRRGGTVEIIE